VSTPNAAELVAIYQHIKANPETWDQETFARKDACGTAYCVAGWAVVRAGYVPDWQSDEDGEFWADYVLKDEDEVRSIRRRAAKILGLDHQRPIPLFRGDNTLDDIRRIILNLTGVDPELAERVTQ
jgi:hypothetical protein